MEQYKEEEKYLENPVLINRIGEDPHLCAHERRQDMDGHKDGHAQPADAMQNIRQHRALSFVSQGLRQADVSFQAHLCLLEE
jgi:hypothetical protein